MKELFILLQEKYQEKIGDFLLLTLKQIRHQQYFYHITCPYSQDWNWNSPYTYLKSRYYMEGASLTVYILQYTNIHPNYITFLYGLSGIVGSGLLALANKTAALIAILIFFNKGILDLADGHLARLKGKVSDFGSYLDTLTGKVGTYSFYIGLGIYLLIRLYFGKINLVFYILPFMAIWGIFKGRKYIFCGRASSVDLILFFLALDILKNIV